MGYGSGTDRGSIKALSSFFNPRGVAILGSFKEGLFGGHVVIGSLVSGGYKGAIYPVNPKYREVLGLKVYPSLADIPGSPELAIIMINARAVLGAIEECAKKGIKAAIVVADGFKERGEEGLLLERQLLQLARSKGVRIIGPNTAGVVDTHNSFYPCPYESGYRQIQKGPISIISQTGMINPQAYPYRAYPVGVSKLIDLGNKCDVDECDILSYLTTDPNTRVISLYLETVTEGRRFLEVSRETGREKPVLVLKVASTQAGAEASMSHTGSMAVRDVVFQATCSQAGLLRLDTFKDLFEIPKIFALQPLPRGNRLGILTITGGISIVALDRAHNYGLVPSKLSTSTQTELNQIFPGLGKLPVDVGPMMATVKDAFGTYSRIMKLILGDPNVDCLLNIVWVSPIGGILDRYVDAYTAMRGRFPKPIATWLYGPDTQATIEFKGLLEVLGFPVFEEPETGIKALGLAVRYSQTRGMLFTK